MTPPTTDPFAAVGPRDWRGRVEEELKGAGFERALVHRSLEGLDVAPLYGVEDGADVARGLPGVAPYVRGARPALGRRWQVAARVDVREANEARALAAEALATGADALELQLGSAERLGATEGAAIADRADLANVLGDVDLRKTPIAFNAGANALPLASLFMAEASVRGLELDELQGHLGADPYEALARDGALPGDITDARRELVQLAVFSRMQFGHVRAIGVDAGPWHRAGGHAVQELGFALAGFVEELRWLQDELPPAAAAAEFVFRVDVGRDLLTEVAKLRALRLLYSKVMIAAGVPVPPMPVVHATTSPRAMTQRDPHTNMLRSTVGAFAAAVGGADWITTLPHDGLDGPGGAAGRRLALTTQLVLAEECHLAHVSDPAGGAYAFEAKTDELAREAWTLMQAIEARGGLAACLADGFALDSLRDSRDELRRRVARRKRPITGVSEFPLEGERLAASADVPTPATVERKRVVLGDIASVDHAIEAATAGATLEAIGNALVRGTPTRSAPLEDAREAAPFEALRDAADAREEAPRAFLACLGTLAEHGPRAQFATNLLRAGGFDVAQGDGAQAPTELIDQLRAAGSVDVVCLCGSDGAYTASGVEAVTALHEERRGTLWYAGRPRDAAHEAELRDAGVAEFVHLGCDALGALERALGATEVTA